MGSASNPQMSAVEYLLQLTLRGCEAARAAANAVADALTSGASKFLDDIRAREEELDRLDREINEGVTAAITNCAGPQSRELLACLKCILELERIGDLLQGFANRAHAILPRLEPQDIKDLTTMATILEKMLSDDSEAFRRRHTELAVAVLRADAEIDRLRNLVFVRHIENPENAPHQESFHVVFMSQALERAGDHAKNIAEEVVHLVTGRSVRHLLRALDKPDEVRFVEWMRQRDARH
jgi:phosphate transport system protein